LSLQRASATSRNAGKFVSAISRCGSSIRECRIMVFRDSRGAGVLARASFLTSSIDGTGRQDHKTDLVMATQELRVSRLFGRVNGYCWSTLVQKAYRNHVTQQTG
jgi:hypothetical protein